MAFTLISNDHKHMYEALAVDLINSKWAKDIRVQIKKYTANSLMV